MNPLSTPLEVCTLLMYFYQIVHGHVGYPCLQESDCTDTMPHSTCTGIDQSNKTCECMNGYQASRGDYACTTVLGASCNNDAHCHELDGGECRMNECHCVTSKVADNNECKTKVGDSCTVDSECPTNANCTDSKCKCVDTHVTDGDKCKTKVGDSCTVDSECPTNANCTDSKCKCVVTHVTDGDKCKSTAVLLKVSWFLIIAVLAIALL